MDFMQELDTLTLPRNFKVQLDGLDLPNAKDVAYLAKRSELLEQYESARCFLSLVETADWDYWYTLEPDIENFDTKNLFFQNKLSARFYETALLYYNIVIDLSWVMTYLAVEYAIYSDEKLHHLENTVSIENVIEMVREAESLVENPFGKTRNKETNPLIYLSNQNYEIRKIIDFLRVFWKEFEHKSLRQTYNYVKHRGKPVYDVIQSLSNERTFSFYLNSNELPSHSSDIKLKLNLRNSIDELLEFDTDLLFPYIKNLLNMLDGYVNPSPICR